uniref:Ribosomal protein S3 n=1 Tax=Lympha mucosa TaxID=2045360 RepID=A0A2D1BK60_9FLOR|nr:ribosomal protein S3 [Lympha mucosa]ATN23353.1 ribosomal protein S3 [Lympha mucosa]
MSRKINPISFRLGLSQVWNGLFQLYGKNLCFYSNILHSKLILENYVKKFFITQELFLDSFCWSTNKKQITLFITYKDTLNYQLLKVGKLKDLIHLLLDLNFKLYLLKTSNWVNSAVLLTNYTTYNLKRDFNFKKVLKDTFTMVNKHLNIKKVVYSNKGPVILNLKGFKFKISGRFDNIRNQMSKTTNQVEGSLPFSQLNSYVEYHNSNIYTKSGVNNLQIWLFYTLKE